MKVDAQVTFEFMIDAPLTWKGEVQGGSASTCVSRAVKKAKEMYPRKKWTSLVVLLAQKGVLDGALQLEENAEEDADEVS